PVYPCLFSIDTPNPNPGDLIEIKWPDFQHWALYMGDGYVFGVPGIPVSTILTGMAKVKKELLEDVAGDHEWQVNNVYDWYHFPLPEEEVIWRAEGYIGKEVPCVVFGSDCEHFVRRLRYGGQVRHLLAARSIFSFLTLPCPLQCFAEE
uniref:LRAT domain-containing protein n=1 Tax=Malurus cyaneus samueli TaxID=2593467 RepID=A0A8C5UHE7_9PASS